jgi:putative serine protease PepD
MQARSPLTLVLAAVLGGGVAAGALTVGHGATHAATRTVATAPASTATASTAATTTTAATIYRRASKGVVDVVVQTSSGPDGFGPPGAVAEAEGTGFVIDRKGHIVTNQHVVDGATSAKVTFADGKTATARVVATDAAHDLAVLKVDVPADELQPLSLTDSSRVLVGDSVLAIGSPFGLSETLTKGIVSAVGRSISSPNNSTISGAIQTDAPLNHGNSGGPLLDAAGRVIGVNAQIASDSGGNDGIGFAIPSNTVRTVVNRLLEGTGGSAAV